MERSECKIGKTRIKDARGIQDKDLEVKRSLRMDKRKWADDITLEKKKML